MNDPSVLVIPDLPFHIGPTLEPSNPGGIPDTFPFELVFDQRRALLVQRTSPDVEQLLERAYRIGLEIGTPLADDAYGVPYVDDFLGFIRSRSCGHGRALEIGAGVGYLSKRLKDSGWTVDSLEPGKGYKEHWKTYSVDVINDYFPSPHARGPYDLICSYAVLEHIPGPERFLNAVLEHLAPGGKFIMSVPDCSMEIAIGDPAMLMHEHFNYFDASGLQALLSQSGFAAEITTSGYGRAIYASAHVSTQQVCRMETVSSVMIRDYPVRCATLMKRARAALAALADRGTLGIYCPTRALAILPKNVQCRFFDDSSALRGKYVPPFSSSIEPRAALIASPTDFVVIMSYTFASKLKSELSPLLPTSKVLSVAELLSPSVTTFGS